MGPADKATNKAKELKGKGKEAAGQATDAKLKAKGKTDQPRTTSSSKLGGPHHPQTAHQ